MGKAEAPRGVIWKNDWDLTRRHHEGWWKQQDMVLWVTAPKDKPWDEIPQPAAARDLEERWFGAEWRARQQEYGLSRTYFGGDAFPLATTWSGAGDLGAYLGCPVKLAPATVWFEPIMADPPEDFPRLGLKRDNDVFRKATALIERCVEVSRGRFLAAQPDLVENIDILASLRGTQTLLMDMIERPEWVERCVGEINEAFFEAFDHFYQIIKDEHGGNAFAFNIWGPGKTAKVQCDACSMFSPAMFGRFVTPALTAQCQWLDYAMFHLDGEQCLPHLDALLAIEPLQAIEWTPVGCARGEGGGRAEWYPLYRKILKAGKSVQAIAVGYDEVIPLLDACGGKGMYVMTYAETEAAARRLEEKVQAYR